MSIIKIQSQSGNNCIRLSQLLENCPEYNCLKDPSMSLDLDNLYQITQKCFIDLNNQIENTYAQKKNQTGGSKTNIEDISQPSNNFFDGTPFTNVKDLYINVRKYMKLHQITHLTEKTMIPYGIILSTLNLPDDLIVLGQLYPDLIQYLSKNQLVEVLNFETLIPIGIFINQIDMNNINHLKLENNKL